MTSGGTAFTLPTSDGTSNQALTTNALVALSFSTAKLVGKETIFVHRANANTTNFCADLAQTELSNGPELKSLDFDKDSDEFAQFTVAFPKSWNEGTVTFILYCHNEHRDDCMGELGVRLQMMIQQTLHLVLLLLRCRRKWNFKRFKIGQTVTIAGSPSTDELVFFKYKEMCLDSLTADAKLLGIKLFFTTDYK